MNGNAFVSTGQGTVPYTLSIFFPQASSCSCSLFTTVGAKEKDRGGWDNQPLKDYAEDPNSGDMSTPILK